MHPEPSGPFHLGLGHLRLPSSSTPPGPGTGQVPTKPPPSKHLHPPLGEQESGPKTLGAGSQQRSGWVASRQKQFRVLEAELSWPRTGGFLLSQRHERARALRGKRGKCDGGAGTHGWVHPKDEGRSLQPTAAGVHLPLCPGRQRGRQKPHTFSWRFPAPVSRSPQGVRRSTNLSL